MNPDSVTSALDRASENGEQVTLRRLTGTTNQVRTGVTFQAVVKPQEATGIVDGVQQEAHHVIFSPTALAARQWPLPPVDGDEIEIDGRWREVSQVKLKRVGGELVRIELWAMG